MCGEMMWFPETVEEFMEDYKIVDDKMVYSNGVEFVPIYRMEQWFAHKPQQEWISVKEELPKNRREYFCICQFGDDPTWRFCNVLMFHPEKNGDNGFVKGPHFSNEGMDGMRVVYWMPIPKMPDLTEEERKNG